MGDGEPQEPSTEPLNLATLPQVLAERLVARRTRAGLTREQVAMVLGVSYRIYLYWETAKAWPTKGDYRKRLDKWLAT